MDSTATTKTESEIEDLGNDNTIVKFVALVLYQATKEGATEVSFAAEDCREAELEQARNDGAQPAELDALRAAMENHGVDFAHFFPSRGFLFSIQYRVGEKLHPMDPPPRYLFSPVICRLCVMAGIRYWAKGRVEDFFNHTSHTIESRAVLWRAHSDDLRKSITLTHATAAQAEEYARRKLIEVPPLPAPLPDEPMPECLRRPIAPRNWKEALVWFVARTVFYTFSVGCACLFLRALNESLQPSYRDDEDILGWLILILGPGIAALIHVLSKKRASLK